MLNEHDREDGPEEGEYHFSDEGGYESNMEEEAKAPVVSEAGGLATKFSSYRRFVIIGAIAAGVLLVAYLVIPPLTSSTPTEIAAVTPAPKETVAVQNVKPSPVAALVKKVKEQKPLANMPPNPPAMKTLAPISTPTSATVAVAPPASPPAQPNENEGTTESNFPNSFVGTTSSPVISTVEEFTSPLASQQAIRTLAENKAILDRLTAMEETNSKLIGQLHAEQAQKLADYETQNKALQEQVRTLTTRLSSMQAEMDKLAQTLNKQTLASNESLNKTDENNSSAVQASASAALAPSIQAGYKTNYTVQAIIPGRAWLRSENGETVTVAEGDVLKSLGRVTKIDPYDGTILIDTGTKVLTLTYGNGDYA
ncbi:MAG TPA: hypothetical protein VLH77_05590 [Gammaproteobacteria bacterium]|nr:hypothetical protein [Gammaproteobacteria bacterium]